MICKLAVLTSHPIHYQAPLFKKMAEKFDLTVYFCWDFGINEGEYDKEFGKKFKWDVPLLDGYNYKFLNNFSSKPSSEFFGQINFGIINELRKNKHDAILIFGWNSFTNWLAFFTAFVFKIPVILRGESPLNQEILKSKWKINLKKAVLIPLFKIISGFLYIGEENRRFYQYYGVPENKLFFVPYAVDNDRFIKSGELLRTKRKELRSKMGIGENDIAIIFVGKLIDKKRPMDLLKAYKLLITNYQLPLTPHLIFVGDGVLRPELENYCRENDLKNVHFVGFKNQTELPEYYAIVDIFVLPSGLGETWGLVVNEAMCFGLPIIVSDKVGCGKDLVRENENGFIFPEGNIESLKKYLEILIMDSNKIGLFGRKSFEIVQGYDYNGDVKSIVKFFENFTNA